MLRRDLLIIMGFYLAACILYLGWALNVTEPGYPLDDSWIHQVFARNIVSGHGFSFNPDIPISGATAPLWTLIMALLWPLLGPIAGGILAGVILEFLAIVAIYKLTVQLTGRGDLAFWVSLVSALTCVLIWGALSGMEVGLYCALSLWGLFFYFKSESFSDNNNFLAYAFLALAILARPECSLFLAVAVARDFWEWRRLPQKSIYPWIGRLLIPIIILLPYFAFNYSTGGSLFPQTFTAKVQGQGLITVLPMGDIKRIAKVLIVDSYLSTQEFVIKLLKLNPFLLLGLLAGILKLWNVRDQLCSKRRMLMLLLILALPLMGAFAPGQAVTHQNMRLLDNLILLLTSVGIAGLFWDNKINFNKRPFWVISGALFLAGILLVSDLLFKLLGPYLLHTFTRLETGQEYHLLFRNMHNIGAGCLLLGVVFAGATMVTFRSIQQWLAGNIGRHIALGLVITYAIAALIYRGSFYANNVKNINEMDKRVGLYLNDIAGPDKKVAVNDIGAIGYFSRAKILDLKGLISPEITPVMILNDSLAFEYMMRHDRVDYLAIFPYWFRYIPRRADIFTPVKSFGVGRNTILGGDTTVVYKANWPALLDNKQ